MSARIKVLLILLLVPFWIYLRGVYRDRLGAFGCFDDCFNIVAGYFLGQGKHVYSEFFFNHQPIPAYISYLIQQVYQPQSIYELIYRHRMSLIGFFALADVFLVLRFGMAGFAFALLYETTKGFLFGERFLAESMIVYPLVYLFGLVWQKKTYRFEPITVAVATWFVVFSREPYVPLALLFLWCHRSRLTVTLFVLLSMGTIFFHNVSAYWWNVVTVNAKAVGEGLSPSIFTYPITVFFGGQWNFFRWIEVVLTGFLLLSLLRSGYKRVFFVFLVLGLANIRPVDPGTIYYVAFHHLIYYALLIASVLFFEKRWHVFIAPLILFAVLSPQSYLYEHVDRAGQFGIGYGHYIMQGEIIKRLAQPSNTLFLEEWDDLIYWQAKLPSAYRYSWYTSSMRNYSLYRDAREEMFRNYPPDFYYGQCGKNGEVSLRNDDYIRLTQGKTPTCIFVKKEVVAKIPDDRWKSVLDFSIDKPKQ
ncbi:MAG: hypothetical protein UY08_C0004G0021 [Candidatus Gottesmanbacteria bacterium GW2011_GWA1_47_8]|uniref:Glycosyltransferase RgtA/B/C/D-like domain-containing protein n=1 Tax=Candidatus Gottesmanbacteria bacterium GW2011_GWA1_47_8 TaxID=1618438 RepID=A0A0G1VS63_9BACT|nr:MAG: hypothetical protein UY08_C0004G0021 [Candidatus Gottesmanbacteria bacterium GW2011_GWA1_47_8]